MWEAIRANKRRSFLLVTVLAAILIGLGYVIAMAIHPSAGPIGVLVALSIWLLLFLTAVVGGRQVLLSSVHARRIDHDDYPVVFNVVEEMTIAAGLPKVPRVFLIDSDAPNAFAVGTEKDSAVAVTTGLLMRLNRDELQGVVAHEIGHIKNADTRFMTVAGVMVAAIVLIADSFLWAMFFGGRGRRRSSGRGGGGQLPILVIALVLAVLAPLMARLLYFACSRRREYLADASSAQFTRYPEGLASALERISQSATRMKGINRAVAPMFTVNPLKASGGRSLLSTHPPTTERVRVLRSMAGGAGYASYEASYAAVRGQHLLGHRTLAESKPVSTRAPSAEAEKNDLAKARETVDILHRLNGMLFLTCACGLKVKVPQSFKGSEFHCPRCDRTVPIPMAAIAGAVAASGEIAEALEEQDRHQAEPGVVQHTPGQWGSFRCPCGGAIQLSPNFRAAQIQCRSCGRRHEVEQVEG